MLRFTPLVGAALLLVLADGRSLLARQAPPAASTALQGAVIHGTVHDSTRSGPLEGATVLVWHTDISAITDAAGRYQLSDVPPGTHSVVFFHPRLAALGVSSGTRDVTVAPDDRIRLDLTTPSMPTILSLFCESERPSRAASRAFGFVGDAATGVPLPGSTVVLTWRGDSQSGQRSGVAEATANREGWYSLCSLPTGTLLTGQAHFLGKETRRRELRLLEGVAARVDFLLGAASPATVSGVLRDAETSERIEGAEIRLSGFEQPVITDARGRFEFAEVPAGHHTLSVSHIVYGAREDPLEVVGGQELDIEVQLSTRVIELAPLVVTVRSQAEAQAVTLGGRLISRSDVDQVRTRVRDAADILDSQNISGLFLRRTATGVCVGFRRGQVRISFTDCVPAEVYIDNARAADPTVALGMSPEAVDRIVAVPPVEAGVLFGAGSSSGVIMVFTRSR